MLEHDSEDALYRYHLPLLFTGGELVDDFTVREDDTIDHRYKYYWDDPSVLKDDIDDIATRSFVTSRIMVVANYMPVLCKEVILPGRRL